MNIGSKIDELYELRSMRLDFEKQIEEIKREEKALEEELIAETVELGVTSLKGSTASFSVSFEVVPTMPPTDILDFHKFS